MLIFCRAVKVFFYCLVSTMTPLPPFSNRNVNSAKKSPHDTGDESQYSRSNNNIMFTDRCHHHREDRWELPPHLRREGPLHRAPHHQGGGLGESAELRDGLRDGTPVSLCRAGLPAGGRHPWAENWGMTFWCQCAGQGWMAMFVIVRTGTGFIDELGTLHGVLVSVY